MDFTSMSDLLSCSRKYQLSRKLGLMPFGGDKSSLAFGGLWHKILEHHGKGLPVDTFEPPSEWTDPFDDYRTMEKARNGYRSWLDKGYGYEYLQTELKIEDRKSFPLEPYVGIIDAIVKADVGQGKGKELFVVDYKTASRLEADWVSFYRLSNQFKFYYIMGKALYPELAGVIVDVYHATRGNKKSKDPAEASGNRFYQLVIRYNGEELEEAMRDYQTAVELAQLYEKSGYYPKNTHACHAFNSSCVFTEYCAASNHGRDLLRLSYDVKERKTDDGRTIIA